MFSLQTVLVVGLPCAVQIPVDLEGFPVADVEFIAPLSEALASSVVVEGNLVGVPSLGIEPPDGEFDGVRVTQVEIAIPLLLWEPLWVRSKIGGLADDLERVQRTGVHQLRMMGLWLGSRSSGRFQPLGTECAGLLDIDRRGSCSTLRSFQLLSLLLPPVDIPPFTKEWTIQCGMA